MTPTDRTRLLKLLRLLGSDQDGERAAAAMKAHELVQKIGGWDVVLPAVSAPPPASQPQPSQQYQNPYKDPFGYANHSQQAYYNSQAMNQGMGGNFNQGAAQQPTRDQAKTLQDILDAMGGFKRG